MHVCFSVCTEVFVKLVCDGVMKNVLACTFFIGKFLLRRNIAELTGCQWFSTVLSFSNEKLNVQE